MNFERNLAKLIFIIAYAGIAIVGAQYLGAAYAPSYLIVLSGLFAFCYGALASGRGIVSLATVFAFTFVFPIIVLIAIGLPVYRTWLKTMISLISNFVTYYQFWGLEMFFPLLAACCGAFVAYSRRSKRASTTTL